MNVSRVIALFVIVPGMGFAAPAEETIAPLVQQSLPGIPGKQFTAVVVTFSPGARAVPHRHGTAFLYAYVLEGSVRSQLDGQPMRTYQAGEGWTEFPGARHLITQNTSTSVPARLLVTFVSDDRAPLKTPESP
ncbi:cupin domain-containing protein [Microvirga antarctica]|uniref:cupin domain-containing protein n=1 Tax=Microvirga antarctica TaxID=2819233 RepID=UPI001B3185E9|nr:cupin domain-containing protein [Microvirga antarctica]